MGLRYFDGRSWADITREERFFCLRLYELIREHGTDTFISHVNEVCGTSLPPDCQWEPAFEVCFYRDLWHHRGRHGAPFSRKRTFDLCLFSDDAILVIEAKADQPFKRGQLSTFSADRDQIRRETGVATVVLVGLASSRYQFPKDFPQVFDGPLMTWKDLASTYSCDPILQRADDIFNPRESGTGRANNTGGYMTGEELLAAYRAKEVFFVGRMGGLEGDLLREDIRSGGWTTQRYRTDRVSSTPPNQNWFHLSDFGRLVS